MCTVSFLLRSSTIIWNQLSAFYSYENAFGSFVVSYWHITLTTGLLHRDSGMWLQGQWCARRTRLGSILWSPWLTKTVKGSDIPIQRVIQKVNITPLIGMPTKELSVSDRNFGQEHLYVWSVPLYAKILRFFCIMMISLGPSIALVIASVGSFSSQV